MFKLDNQLLIALAYSQMSNKLPLHIIAAIDKNNGLGINNTIPWHLSADLKYFKKITTEVTAANKQNAVIMGRKTWDSIPDKYKPLPERLNIVLTRNQNIQLPENVLSFSSLEQATKTLNQPPQANNIENLFIIGGASIYEQAINLPDCSKLYLTHLKKEYHCDTFFPKYEKYFKLISKSEVHEEKGIEFFFSIYSSI